MSMIDALRGLKNHLLGNLSDVDDSGAMDCDFLIYDQDNFEWVDAPSHTYEMQNRCIAKDKTVPTGWYWRQRNPKIKVGVRVKIQAGGIMRV